MAKCGRCLNSIIILWNCSTILNSEQHLNLETFKISNTFEKYLVEFIFVKNLLKIIHFVQLSLNLISLNRMREPTTVLIM